MLVKFLSFIASIFGTAKYKAILLSSFALLLSVSGILAVLMTQPDSTPKHDASAVIRNVADSLGVQNGAIDTPHDDEQPAANDSSNNQPAQTNTSQQDTNASGQSTKSSSSSTANQNNNTSNSSSATSNTSSSSTPTITTTTKSPLTLSAGQTSNAITYTTSDDSNVTWTITPSDTTNLTIAPQPSSQASSSVTFQITAAASAPSKNYEVAVTAEEANGTTTTDIITVTVTAQ